MESEAVAIRRTAGGLPRDAISRWLNEYADMLDDIEFVGVPPGLTIEVNVDAERRTAEHREQSKRMMIRSGVIVDRRPVVAFIYLLARNEIPVGAVEQIMRDLADRDKDFGSFSFTNGWLARWARDVADRLVM